MERKAMPRKVVVVGSALADTTVTAAVVVNNAFNIVDLGLVNVLDWLGNDIEKATRVAMMTKVSQNIRERDFTDDQMDVFIADSIKEAKASRAAKAKTSTKGAK